MKRKILSMLLVSAILASVTGCGEQKTVSQPTATEKTASGDITVGVILKTLSSEYWGYVAAGVQAASKDLGVKVDLQGPASETAYDEQNNMIETMLSGGVDAFVISPLQSDSVASVIGDVKIPVITVDTDAEIPGKVSFVGTGNDNAAYQGGLFAAKKKPEKVQKPLLSEALRQCHQRCPSGRIYKSSGRKWCRGCFHTVCPIQSGYGCKCNGKYHNRSERRYSDRMLPQR